MIPVEALKPGYLYRVMARNINAGVWNPDAQGHGAFIGIRTKFASRFLDTELHWDSDPRYGTARPLQEIGPCPITNIGVHGRGLVCRKCDALMEKQGEAGSIRHVHVAPTDCDEKWGWLDSNQELFEWLDKTAPDLIKSVQEENSDNNDNVLSDSKGSDYLADSSK